jgi:3-hydroxybutyrate dehydrogenase
MTTPDLKMNAKKDTKTATKTALITGSTSGIGLGIARKLASQGFNIALNGFGDTQVIETLRSELAHQYKVQVSYDAADMRSVTDIERMVHGAISQFGGIDVLVNNAGIQHVAPIDEFPIEKYQDIIAINMSSAWHTTRLVLPTMKQRGWGRIVNMASAHALVASKYKSAYVMAKHGIAGLTKTTALEVAEHGITVNAICPGYVWTPLVERQVPDTAKARGISEAQVISDVMLANQPTKQFVKIEQVAALAAFLISDDASSITGALQSIDGGWTAH